MGFSAKAYLFVAIIYFCWLFFHVQLQPEIGTGTVHPGIECFRFPAAPY